LHPYSSINQIEPLPISPQLSSSRLDLYLTNKAAAGNAIPKGAGVVVRWSLFDDLSIMGNVERQKLFKNFTHFISDHLPVLSRFYTVDKDSA
jgi:hypothetical protein